MANRTVQVWGQGYGASPATANVTFNGNTVFSGQIPTIDSSVVYRLPDEQTVLFTFEIPVDLAGTFPVEVVFTGQDAYLSRVFANYSTTSNPVYNPTNREIITSATSTFAEKLAVWTQLAQPALTSEEITVLETGSAVEKTAVLATHNLLLNISTGPDTFTAIAPVPYKINTTVDGVIVTTPDPRPSGAEGEWGWEIPSIDNQGTITFDLVIVAGFE
jgi:hypothetical protein